MELAVEESLQFKVLFYSSFNELQSINHTFMQKIVRRVNKRSYQNFRDIIPGICKLLL